MIDREGIVRWVNIEGATEGTAGIGRFPSQKDLFAAKQGSVRSSASEGPSRIGG